MGETLVAETSIGSIARSRLPHTRSDASQNNTKASRIASS